MSSKGKLFFSMPCTEHCPYKRAGQTLKVEEEEEEGVNKNEFFLLGHCVMLRLKYGRMQISQTFFKATLLYFSAP